MDIHYEHDAGTVSIRAERIDGGWRVQLPDGAYYDITVGAQLDQTMRVTARQAGPAGATGPERILRIPYVRSAHTVEFSWKGQIYRFAKAEQGTERTRSMVSGERAAHGVDDSASDAITAPTGGVVADVFVAEGQVVDAFQQIAVVEAMKVMTMVEAPRAGRVGALFVSRGERIEQGAAIARIDMPASASLQQGVAS